MPVRGERLTERAVPPEPFRQRWILLWDGECGFCRRWVERALRRDKTGMLRACPYQQCTGWLPQPVLDRSSIQAHLRSPDGRYWGGGDAAIRLIGLLGHPGWEAVLGLPPLRMLVRAAYRAVAGQRRRLAGWGL